MTRRKRLERESKASACLYSISTHNSVRLVQFPPRSGSFVRDAKLRLYNTPSGYQVAECLSDSTGGWMDGWIDG